jgi:hypothetical protein
LCLEFGELALFLPDKVLNLALLLLGGRVGILLSASLLIAKPRLVSFWKLAEFFLLVPSIGETRRLWRSTGIP